MKNYQQCYFKITGSLLEGVPPEFYIILANSFLNEIQSLFITLNCNSYSCTNAL